MRPDYGKAVTWIVRERGGGGGHPPEDVAKVSGWLVTRMVADLFDVPVQQVARDLIEMNEVLDAD